VNKENEIENKIIAILSDVLNKDKINSETSQDNTEEWDSLTYLTILTHLEKEFNIDINEKNIYQYCDFL
tara:strand:+ start:431 stop:637 length:207 start_codon:yes stop_codon:yes gene_type:complete